MGKAKRARPRGHGALISGLPEISNHWCAGRAGPTLRAPSSTLRGHAVAFGNPRSTADASCGEAISRDPSIVVVLSRGRHSMLYEATLPNTLCGLPKKFAGLNSGGVCHHMR